MSVSRKVLIGILNKKYPNLNLRTTEEFNGQTGGIWVSGTEDEIEAKDGFNLFDYYNEDYNETRYQFGVHKEIRTVLEEHGWYGEWNDPGTMMFWEV
jgi:hypothetical protein